MKKLKYLLAAIGLCLLGSFCMISSGTLQASAQQVESKFLPHMAFTQLETEKTYGDKPFTVTCNSDSDGELKYYSSNTSVAKVDKSTGVVTIVGAGRCNLEAFSSETDTYYFGHTSSILIVQKETVKASFKKKAITKTFGAKPFVNKLTTKAKGNIVYESSNPDVAMVNPKTGKVCIMGTGKCKIKVTIKETSNRKEYKTSYKLVVKTRKKVKIRMLCSDEWNLDGHIRNKKILKWMKKEYKKAYKWVFNAGVTDGMNPETAMQKMADYICKRCRYDYSFHRYEMKDMLYGGCGVCNAYAELLMIMGKTAGIDCRIQVGFCDGGFHGWNKFRTVKGWRYVDSCMLDAGGPRWVSKWLWSMYDATGLRNYFPVHNDTDPYYK